MKLKSIKIAVNRTEAVARELKTPIPLREDTELHEIIRKHVDALMRELIEQHADLPNPNFQAGGTL
jgi:hypothetical protein